MSMRHDLGNDAMLRSIFDALGQGVSIHDAQRRLVYANAAMTAVTGGKAAAGAPLDQFVNQHRLFSEAGEEIVPSEFPIERAFRGQETRDEVYEYVDGSGIHYWLQVSCRRIETDGELQYVLTTITDVTRRKNRENKLRFMIESAKILSLTSDTRQRLIEKARLAVPTLADWCAIDILKDNGATERLAVINQDAAKVRLIQELEQKFPSDPEAPNSVLNVIRSNKPQFIPIITDEMIAASARSPEHLEAIRSLNLSSIMIVPIAAGGIGLGALTLAYAESGRVYSEEDLNFFVEYGYHVGVVLDNARLFEEIERADKAKDLFLASLSHELRNPLAPIKSSLELLKYGEDVSPEIREELSVIEHQFDHMAKLLNDLLDVSRFTQGKIRLTKRPIELRKLVERALKATDTLLKTADITLHFTYPSSSLSIEADDTRLEQAIVNLMSNAAKFTPAGGSIWVNVAREHNRACIRVRDNGAGISKSDLPKIFEMYYQSQREMNANTGLGIGLLLVRQIVGLHGGTIEAHSEGLGRGSEFVIYLPLSEETAASAQSGAEETGSFARRILIVDDNAQAADSLAKLLRRLGAEAQTSYSAEETLARNDLATFDVLLLDIGMPQVDGYELARALRARGIQAPLIALTGYGMADDKKRAADAGFTAHLTKPIGIAELRDAFSAI